MEVSVDTICSPVSTVSIPITIEENSMAITQCSLYIVVYRHTPCILLACCPVCQYCQVDQVMPSEIPTLNYVWSWSTVDAFMACISFSQCGLP